MKEFYDKIAARFKKFLRTVAIAGSVAACSAPAADLFTTTNLVANTPFTLLSGGDLVIKSIFFVNANTTNNAVIKGYDSTANATSIVLAATTTYSEIVTNYSHVWTNEFDQIITNIVNNAIARVPNSLSLRTNERPYAVGPFVVLANGNRTVTTSIRPALGFTLLSSQAGLVEVQYETVPAL